MRLLNTAEIHATSGGKITDYIIPTLIVGTYTYFIGSITYMIINKDYEGLEKWRNLTSCAQSDRLEF